MAPSTVTPLSPSKRKRFHESSANVVKKVARVQKPCPKPDLRIVTDVILSSPSIDQLLSATDSDADSLFDEPPPQLSTPDISVLDSVLAPKITDEVLPDLNHPSCLVAKRTAPPIPGLYFDPSILLPEALADDLMWTCIRTFFRDGTANQVMLFERAPDSAASTPATTGSSGLPKCLTDLLSRLDDMLRSAVPAETHDLLFSPSPASHTGPPRARQAIINLYWPGEGITPHVDLLDRYGDGIIGVSLGSGCVMQFARASDASAEEEAECALYLPKGSVLVMTKEARYEWTHGIAKRFDDLVEETGGAAQGVLLERNVRLSITFRWLLPGADVVGPTLASSNDGVRGS
ncbi:hypothetical protein ONZ51_g9071 [Trametes cubensis]|uniref:Fe2OG dioxygenase domain-containing protein n=1 Tax=Trametes cubensis TaxID=1111947 RepID=A0AAD7XA68_9APHY|nr:hypothetical protein ONZ51_g9071 [Trametes cubensis]